MTAKPPQGEKTVENMKETDLAKYIDHTFLKPAGDLGAIERLCREAAVYGFASVCVNPAEVAAAKRLLANTSVKVCTVVDFPLGAATWESKALQMELACKDGADECDIVVDIRRLQAAADGDAASRENLEAGLALCVRCAADMAARRAGGVVLKLILECCFLTDAAKVLGCKMAKAAGFDFVKTSTGFGPGGATVNDVRLMRETVGSGMGVKAAGGIRTREDALAMIAAGADRLGCSASIAIVGGRSGGNPAEPGRFCT